tara:strand:- start:75 stop:266 length:192 start_codon:yes stop_codon:yes gene_type:complete
VAAAAQVIITVRAAQVADKARRQTRHYLAKTDKEVTTKAKAVNLHEVVVTATALRHAPLLVRF